MLDIGAGVGAVHLALLDAGATAAVDVDISPAFVAAARDEAARRGRSDAVTYEIGDFVALAPALEPADIVALDRVVCCYGDMRALVSLSASRARHRYGLVYPRDAWWIRGGARLGNALSRLFRSKTRIYIHASRDVDELVRVEGFERRMLRKTSFWQVVVYERPG